MSAHRAPIDPPRLDGYTHLQLLGSGGFSDVFLYQGHFPEREVAIKVLLPDAVRDHDNRRFTDEANVMARLSNHPYIVSIIEAGTSSEGYPYLVMEHYPGDDLHSRSRRERLSVAAVLRIGIQVAAAVEHAHRMGVFHRDIKPANILTSEFGRPGLTDFGIATLDEPRDGEAEGLSVPWAPPEVVTGTGVGDARSDVYSLAASLWTLLSAGRSPYEVVGGSNRSIDLIDRIERGNVPPVDRADVPDSLQRLLAQAMSHEPRARPASAAELARALQVIEVEQRFDMTPFEVREERAAAPAETPIDADAGETRVKGLAVIEAQRSERRRGVRDGEDEAFRPGGRIAPTAPERSRPRPAMVPLISETPYVAPPGGSAPVSVSVEAAATIAGGSGAPTAGVYEPPPSTPASGRAGRARRSGILVAAVIAVALLAGGLFWLLAGDDSEEVTPSTTTSLPPAPDAPPSVDSVTVEDLGDGDYEVRWESDAVRSGDVFEIGGPATEGERTSRAREWAFRSSSASPCVSVTIRRDQQTGPTVWNRGCP